MYKICVHLYSVDNISLSLQGKVNLNFSSVFSLFADTSIILYFFRQESLITTTSKNLARKLQCRKHSVSVFVQFTCRITSLFLILLLIIWLVRLFVKLSFNCMLRGGEWSFKIFIEFHSINYLLLCSSGSLEFLQSFLSVSTF